MQETVGRITVLEQRVGTMDMELKAYFQEMRAYTSQAIAGLGERIDGVEARVGARINGVEARLGARIEALSGRVNGVETRLERFERDAKAGFQIVDGRLGRVERRFDRVDLKLVHMDQRLDTLLRRLPKPSRASRPNRRRSRKASR